jgi:hypothetical protein
VGEGMGERLRHEIKQELAFINKKGVITMFKSLTKCFLFAALFISINAFAANNTLITITKPYDNGSVDVNINNFDTISFSNGTRIWIGFPFDMIPESHLTMGGIVFLDSTHTKIGYKYADSIHRDSMTGMNLMFNNTVYFLDANPDTVWNDAVRFPAKLHELDSVRGSGSQQNYLGCKYIYVNTVMAVPVWVSEPLPNYNSIVYVTSHDGQNMKLQVYGIGYENHTLPGTGYSFPSVISYKLRWAVDSLGNGKFDIPTRASGSGINKARSYNKSDIASLHFWSKNSRIRNGYLVNGRIVRAIDARVVPHITKNQQ